MQKKKNQTNYHFLIKPLLSAIYLIIFFVLVYASYQLFLQDQKEVHWKDVKETDEYAWLEINQMSEAFAKIGDKQIHFVMEKEKTGAWHTYLIAISKDDYSKYQTLIDYTYERTTEKPQAIKVYGYPVEINKKLKKLAIKNITNFVPIENEIKITDQNFNDYLTDTYLDTTIEKTHLFNNSILILLILALFIFIAFIMTIMDKNIIKNKNNQKKNNNKIENKTAKNTKSVQKAPKKDKEKKNTSKNRQKKEEEIEII